MNSLKIVGIMTGTSLDGIDISFCKYSDDSIEKIFFETIKYNGDIKDKIKSAIKGTLSIDEICSLNYELGYEYSNAIKSAFKKNGISLSEIDAVGNHGQTIYHINDNIGGLIKSTMQMGEPAIISKEINTIVIDDFRSSDIACGGKGAPLISAFDNFIFKVDDDTNIVTLNIGGISNISILADEQLSFDTGPGNMIINYFMNKFYDCDYDDKGQVASTGCINEEMLSYLLDNNFFKLKAPKSTGREDFGEEFCEQLFNKFSNVEHKDFISTVTKFTVDSIVLGIKKNIKIKKNNRLVIAGGGFYNQMLVKLLSNDLENFEIESIEKYGFNLDEKEAIAFGYFAFCNVTGKKLSVDGKDKVSIWGSKTNVNLREIKW